MARKKKVETSADKTIVINTGERPRINYKKEITKWIVLLVIGFAAGYFFEVKQLKNTKIEKSKKIEKLTEQNKVLEDRLQFLKLTQDKIIEEGEKVIDSLEKLSVSDCQIFFDKNYK